MWDLIVSVPDHCLSFYFAGRLHKDLLYVDPSIKVRRLIQNFRTLSI